MNPAPPADQQPVHAVDLLGLDPDAEKERYCLIHGLLWDAICAHPAKGGTDFMRLYQAFGLVSERVGDQFALEQAAVMATAVRHQVEATEKLQNHFSE